MKENSPETLSRLIFSIPKAEAELVLSYLRIQKGQKKECEILEKLYRKNILPATGFSELPTIELSFREVRNLVRLWVEAIRQVSPDPGQQALRHLADAQIFYSAGLPGRCLACVDAGIEIASSVDAFHVLGELIQLGKKVSFYTGQSEKEAQMFAHYTALEKNNQAALQQYIDLLTIAESFYYPMVHTTRNSGEIDFDLAERAVENLKLFDRAINSVRSRFWYYYLQSYFTKASPAPHQSIYWSEKVIGLYEKNKWIELERPDLLSRELFSLALLACDQQSQQKAKQYIDHLKKLTDRQVFGTEQHQCRQIIAQCVFEEFFGKPATFKALVQNWEWMETSMDTREVQSQVQRIYYMFVKISVQFNLYEELDKWLKKLIYAGRTSIGQHFQIAGRVQHLMGLYQMGNRAQMAISAENYIRYCNRHPEMQGASYAQAVLRLFRKLADAMNRYEENVILKEFINTHLGSNCSNIPTYDLLKMKDWILKIVQQ